MRASEVRALSENRLREKVGELREELLRLRLRRGTGQLNNPMRMRTARRDLARALTVLRQREKEAGRP